MILHKPSTAPSPQFYVGILMAAAGAYMVGALLEWSGRGRTPLARSAHAVAFPLAAIAGLLLAVDLSRPERFWHMVVQSKTMLPVFKYWSPMSLGAVLLLLFGGFTFVSFVDFLVARGAFGLGGWRGIVARQHLLQVRQTLSAQKRH